MSGPFSEASFILSCPPRIPRLLLREAGGWQGAWQEDCQLPWVGGAPGTQHLVGSLRTALTMLWAGRWSTWGALVGGSVGGFFFFFFNFIYLFIYLFMAVLVLRFCVRAFSSCGKWGPFFIAVRRPLTIPTSLVAEHRLQMRRLSNCGSRA